MNKITNKEKANEIAKDAADKGFDRVGAFCCAMAMAEWKDEQYKEREEGLRETIDALDARLQKANEAGMHLFDKYNLQKQQLIEKACEWVKENISLYVSIESKDWERYELLIEKEELTTELKKAMEAEK